MTPIHEMRTFPPPFSMSLHAGLRADVSSLPIRLFEDVLCVRLESEDDLELGGAYYSYAPYPLPDSGLAGVRLHLNNIPGLGLTYKTRPDLLFVLSIELRSSNLLDLGRLAWQLRKAYGDLFDVADYAVMSTPPPDNLSVAPEVHYVQFEPSAGGPGAPLGDPSTLHCSIEFGVAAEHDQAPVRGVITAMRGSSELLRDVTSFQVEHSNEHLSIQFDSTSLLELGMCAQAVESVPGIGLRVLRYTVSGDLLRDGSMVRVERSFASLTEALPGWCTPSGRQQLREN